ncbi:MAG: acetate--CoA ligase family protein [Elusimicrobia bacterium]|nr:acetate--CoA ligase family protein [Elusimicrobiota bacterium]
MRLVEVFGKELFKRAGLKIPRGIRAKTPEEAFRAAESFGGPMVVKAQILAPGRAKKGGVLFVNTPREAQDAAGQLIGKKFGHETVTEVLIEEKLKIKQELYAAVTIDPDKQDVLFILSRKGGGNIEEVFKTSQDAPSQSSHPGGLGPNEPRGGEGSGTTAAASGRNSAPEALRSGVEAPGGRDVVKYNHSPLEPFHAFQGRVLAQRMGLKGQDIVKVSQALTALFKAFKNFQGRLVEINPLVITEGGEVVACDAIFQIDEDAAFRLPVLKELDIPMEEERPRPPTARELAAQEIDKKDYRGVVHYQDLYDDGTVGVVSVGSGFSLTLLDILSAYGLKPVDFCDCSGSPPAPKVYEAVKLVMGIPQIKGFLFLSGVVTQDLTVTAEGIVKAFQELQPKIPFVVRLAGNRDREALKMLKDGGIVESFPRESFVEECVERLKALMYG